MGRPIFTVRGRVASYDGSPITGAYVAIVDADPDLDDLLGAGPITADGSFRLSFTTEAFNQEPLERETVPDLYVVVSVPNVLAGGSVLTPAVRRDFGEAPFAGGARDVDLGTIVIPGPGQPTGVDGTSRVAPGRGKIVKRLRLDDELVELAANEITPLVERFTGWSGLRDGVTIRIIDAYAEDRRARIQHELGRPDLDRVQIARLEATSNECEASVVASWHPDAGEIVLNRMLIEEQGYDFLKVTLGHELVHVGQSRVRPAADALLRRFRIDHGLRSLAGERIPLAATREVNHLLTNIEGYAHYVETFWLRGIYTHAGDLPRPTSAADARFRALAAERALPGITAAPAEETKPSTVEELLDEIYAKKGAQYIVGSGFYRARTKDNRPAPYDPDLEVGKASLETLLALLHAMAYQSP